MPGTLQVGQLVELTGLPGPVDIPEEWRRPGKPYTGAKDLNGARGQVVKWLDDDGHWMVATFDALMVPVKEQNLKPLKFEHVEEYDIALGPRSDPAVMGEEITSAVLLKGVAVCKLFMSPDDMESMLSVADQAIGDGNFVRLPPELEPGYLGQGGTGKTMDLDLEDEDLESYIKESPLKIVEDTFSTVGVLLRPYTGDKLGHDIQSRSNTMMSLPFNGDENSFPPPDFENDEAAHFLQTMYRAKLMALVNVGPGNGVLSLLSREEGENKSLTITPGTMVVLSTKYKYSYLPSDKSLTMRCWYLDYPQTFEITQHPDADLTQFDEFNEKLGTAVPRGDPVAVAAIGTRYAFGAWEPDKLWTILRHAGVDTFIRHPVTRWECDQYYAADADQISGLSYTEHGGFSDGIELFDNKFFDMSNAEAKATDPTQRQMCEVSYIALSGAGFHKKQLMGKSMQIAVLAGIDKNEWQSIPREAGVASTGSANAITSNRFSYIFNLKGASMTIDTACSASLVCTHTAKLYLLHKAWDPCIAAVTCGINLLLSPVSFIGCCASGMLSHKGRSFTYNATADGYARGESTGAHCIKNEPYDTVEKGHLVMIAGSQVNQDGRSASLTAPNGPSQEKCNLAVLKECGISGPEVDCTETHGTGTSLGDPIELGAYIKVLSKDPRSEPVFVTTSKSNIGHCEGSAGISGFIKCLLMAMYGECCPGQHIRSLNPHIDMAGFPGLLLSEGQPYRFDSSYNGVLSFGFGGTNACVQVWGKNLMTSRAAGSKDAFKVVLDKIQKAPPQAVTINGEDWEDWEMDGPGKNVEPGQSWDICILSDGTVQYVEREPDVKDLGTFYYITGSFNNWARIPMEQDDMLDGLYSVVITIGNSGEELFQIVADDDEEMTFFPAIARCHWKSTEVKGPAAAPRDKAWSVTAYPGQMVRVEFAKAENNKVSVMWFNEEP